MSLTKILLIAGGALAAAGLIIGGITFAVFGFDTTKMSTSKYTTNTYEADKGFMNISIEGDTEDIVFVKSDDDNCKLVCYEEVDRPHDVKVENNTLTVTRKNKAYWNFGINFEEPKMTVYLPETIYDDIKIKSDTGDIDIPEEFAFDKMELSVDTGDVKVRSSVNEQISIRTSTGDMDLADIEASELKLETDTGRISINDVDIDGDIDIKVDTGKVTLEKISCNDLISKGDTGAITLRSVMAKGKYHIERSTGDVRFESCDAQEIYVRTHTGDVSGNLLSDKVFITETDTGSIDVPKTTTGGKCEIKTDTGDIRISIG